MTAAWEIRYKRYSSEQPVNLLDFITKFLWMRWECFTCLTKIIGVFFMKLKLLLLLISTILLTSVSGCTIRGPGVRIHPPIHIESGGGPGHCPPGQAKKGRC